MEMATGASRKSSHLRDDGSVNAYEVADIQEKGKNAGQIAVPDKELWIPPDDCWVKPVQDSHRSVSTAGCKDSAHLCIFEQDPEFLGSLAVLSGEKASSPAQKSGYIAKPEA